MTTPEKKQMNMEPAAQSKWMDFIPARPNRYGEQAIPVTVVTHARAHTTPEGEFALRCIERWALIAGEPDGEDGAGRQKVRRMTPAELVTHACDCSDRAFAAIRERGWIVDIPTLASMADAVKDHENSND